GVTAVAAMKIDIEGMEDRALGPFLKPENRHLFPRLLIMETVNREDWQIDILAKLQQNGYVVTSETRGNSILELRS
ncbi:MAG TPA: FkbM family methyltransferase, partial [Alphaproteobacteria bacterium]|nr:FkbM family methyltransferase [Alphaproteobacteria bacterium]